MSVKFAFIPSINRTGLFFVALLAFFIPGLASAQQKVDSKGAITGTVTDQTQAVVTGAKVELSNPAEAKQESQTDEKGNYSFRGLEPGTYTLTVSAPNFGTKVLDNISLTEGLELSLEVTLEPESAKSEVKVEAGSIGQVEVENATVSGTITQQEVVSLGLNGRNFTQLIALAPGVSNQTGQDEATVGVTGSVKYSVNGGRVEYNSFEIDGSDVLNTGLNKASSTLMVYPSLDAIQEVKVLTSNYGAQYGRTASGTVQVLTKSGTNALHGNIYDFVRNEAFNSRNYFDQTRHAPLYRRQDFGGTIGGPLTIPGFYNNKRDKTFFFFSEEVRLDKTPAQYNQAVPSLLERGLRMTPQGIQKNLITDFSGQVHQVFDFSDVCPVPGSPESFGFSRAQFPDCPADPIKSGGGLLFPAVNNDLGTIGVDKNALAILNSNLIPLPNSPSGCSYSIATFVPSDPNHCYTSTISPDAYWREELFRIDQRVNSKMKVSFRYIHDDWDTTVLTPQWGITRNTFPTVQNRFIGPGRDLVATLSHTISPRLINTFSVSYTNSTITLADRNGPGGARFQRDPRLDQPLVADPSAPGQCNPQLNLDPSLPPPSPGGGGSFPQCGMGHIFNNGFGGKMPGVSIQGTNAAYGGRGFAVDPSYMPWSHTNPTYSVRDDVGISVGRHTLQFGGQYILAQRNQTNNAIGAASGDLQGFVTFSNLVHSTGNAFADFLTTYRSANASPVPVGFIQSFSQDSSQHRYYQRYQIGEPYFQDDWKVTQRLTLNLGVRVSLFGTYHEHNRNVWNWEASRFDASRFAVDAFTGVLLDKSAGSTPVQFNPSTFQLDPGVVSALGFVHCGTRGIPSSCMKGHLFNPAPRVGFAWDPKGNGKTSIRGGYGIFFEHGTGVEANTGSLEASAPVVLSVTQPLPVSYMCIGNLGYGPAFDPANRGCSATPSLFTAPPAGSLFPLSIASIPTKAVWPYAQQWSFGVQQEMRGNFVGSITYVGSKGTHLTIEPQLNQLRPLPLSENPFGPNEPLTLDDCTTSPSSGQFPGDGTTPFFLKNGTVVSPQHPAYVYMQAACTNTHTPNVNALPGRPYPGLAQVLALENVANSSYNALQLTLRRSRGPLTAGISYSYSHSIDNSSDRSDPVLVNSYDLRQNRASSNFDQRHLLSISYVYQLPLMKFVQYFSRYAHSDGSTDTPAPLPDCCSGIWKWLLEGWQLSGVTLYQTGTPFTVINNNGNNGVSLSDNAGVSSQWLSSGLGIAESYPDVMPGLPSPDVPAPTQNANTQLVNAQSFGPLLGSPSPFVAPRGLTFGNAGRNSFNNPNRLNFDLALARYIKVREGEIEFRMEAFNIFNHTQFRIYDPDNPGTSGYNVIGCYAGPVYSAGFIAKGGADCISGASFLHPVNAHRPRTIQFGLKWAF
jgi:hypothetical protein